VRILLDEDLNTRLRHAFSDQHRVETVEFRGWKGLKNGELLTRASNEFDVFVTTDNNLPDQRNVSNYDLAVVVLRPRSKSLPDLEELVPETERILPSLRPGDVRRIHPPQMQDTPSS
jgi:predicted nuclease of predicted toxin-antitoxin system